MISSLSLRCGASGIDDFSASLLCFIEHGVFKSVYIAVDRIPDLGLFCQAREAALRKSIELRYP
jgi:hypothetical protein